MICSFNIGYLRLRFEQPKFTNYGICIISRIIFCSTNQKPSILGKQSQHRAYEGLRHKDKTSGFVSKILALISVTKI